MTRTPTEPEKIVEEADGVKIITPRHILREKMGHGGIDPVKLKHAQDYIDNNDADFEPYAIGFLSRIDNAINSARDQGILDRSAINSIIRPVMDMKASGAMFKYALLSEIADILLNFLEDIDTLDADAMEIIAVNRKTMQVIVSGKLKGDGGKQGRALTSELYGAVERYHKKHKSDK